MTQYVGCEHARELLEGLVDGELSMADQLAVESHLRWCRTCALRVEDLKTIGASLRDVAAVSYAKTDEADAAMSAVNDAILMRLSAEEAQSWGARVRDTFSDMRLLWPAMGATAAVAFCVLASASVLHATAAHHEESLASLITNLASPAPLKPAENGFFGISIPRPTEDDALRTAGMLDALPDDDLSYTIRTVVDRDGRPSNFEILLSGGAGHGRSAHAGHDRAVLDAIAQTRFGASHAALGQPVSFDMVWVIAKATAVAPALDRPVPARVAAPPVKAETPAPAVDEPAPAVNPRSSTVRPFSRLRRSATV